MGYEMKKIAIAAALAALFPSAATAALGPDLSQVAPSSKVSALLEDLAQKTVYQPAPLRLPKGHEAKPAARPAPQIVEASEDKLVA